MCSKSRDFAQREIANKIALALDVSLGFLVGNVELELNDTLMEKVKEVNKISYKDKNYVFTLIEAFIVRNKLQTILNKNRHSFEWRFCL